MRPYYYLGKNWALTQLSIGLPFFINTNDRSISPWIIMGGAWETFVDEIMQDLLRQKDVCLDVGANLGYYTVKMAHAVGAGGRVLAFEPNEELYPFLTENVYINGFAGRVRTYAKAVGASAGVGSLKFDSSHMGGGYIDTAVPGEIEIIAIDELPDAPERVDFIKIDVEGMEPLAFAGMARLLKRSPDCVIITEYSRPWQRFGDPVKLLDEVRGSRSKFGIDHDGMLIESTDASHGDDDRISYVLLIHEDDERFQRVAHRIRNDKIEEKQTEKITSYLSEKIKRHLMPEKITCNLPEKITCNLPEKITSDLMPEEHMQEKHKSAFWKLTRPIRGLSEAVLLRRQPSGTPTPQTDERDCGPLADIVDPIPPELALPVATDDKVPTLQPMSTVTNEVSALEMILKQYSHPGNISAESQQQEPSQHNSESQNAELFDISSIAHLARSHAESEIRALCNAIYLGDHEVLCRCLGRYKIFLDSRDVGFAPHIMMDGFWEYWITRFMVTNVQPGFCVLDIGANYGYYTLLLSDLVGCSGRCVAFEPNPQVANKLRKSVAINGFDERTQVEEVALGQEAGGEACLYIPNGEPKNARVIPLECRSSAQGGQVVTVSRATVDSLLKDITRIDFVKIDAEGAEADIISGMEETLKRLRPMLLLEFNAARGYNGRNLVEQLSGIYGSLRYVDFDAELKPVSVQELLETNVGNDWMLYFST